MCVLPIHHVNGTVVTFMTPFYCKGSVVLNGSSRQLRFWRLLHEEQVTLVSVVPTLLEFLLDANEDLTAYQLDRFGGCICGAGPLLKDTAARASRNGFTFRSDMATAYRKRRATPASCPMIYHRMSTVIG